MAAGDAAGAKGLNVYDGNEDANELWIRDNERGDEIAGVIDSVQAVSTAVSGKASVSHTHSASSIPTSGSNVQADINYLNSIKANLAGAVFSGDVWVPASSGAVSAYTVAYINGDGRISRGVSAAKYKKFIHDAPDLGNLFPTPLREWQMKANGIDPADPTWRLGYIADELVGTDLERFVVFINDEVESIDFIALLMAQVAQLNERLTALEGSE